MLRVAITSPSLDFASNISGISNHTRLLIESSDQVVYSHIRVGRKDAQKRNGFWLLSQWTILKNFVVGITSTDLVHLNVPLANLAIALNVVLIVVAKAAKKKIVVHFRGGELSLRTRHNFLQRAAIRVFLRLSNAVITLGSREKEFFIENYGLNLKLKIHVLPNAVKIHPIDSDLAVRKFSRPCLELIYFGRMDLAKGLAEISQALEICSDEFEFHFNAVGDGPDLPEFERLLRRHADKKYTLHGSKTQEQLLTILERCHVFVLPSHFEGLPNSLLEAMANYLVPVVTPVGSISEVVKSQYNGFVVPVNDPTTLAKTLCVAAEDRELLSLMANRGRTSMEKDFSIDSYCEKLLTIYRKAIV